MLGMLYRHGGLPGPGRCQWHSGRPKRQRVLGYSRMVRWAMDSRAFIGERLSFSPSDRSCAASARCGVRRQLDASLLVMGSLVVGSFQCDMSGHHALDIGHCQRRCTLVCGNLCMRRDHRAYLARSLSMAEAELADRPVFDLAVEGELGAQCAAMAQCIHETGCRDGEDNSLCPDQADCTTPRNPQIRGHHHTRVNRRARLSQTILLPLCSRRSWPTHGPTSTTKSA
jgi:hypothetical protein